MEKLAMLIPIVFGLMLLVNVFTEVLKKVLPGKIPANLLVFALSIIITVAASFVYFGVTGITFVWWMIFLVIAIAFFVAYSAMFGFDKWKELVDQWKQFRTK